MVVPCVAVFPTRSICLRYRVGGAQWGVAPAPSTLPGEKEAKHKHPRDPDPINHPPGAVYVHRYSALSRLGKGGVIGSLADGFFFGLF